MNKGKGICKTLKDIRKRIADANDIKYEPEVCNFEGDCAGTCPKCEEEVKYIEQQLSIRRMLGKAVVVAGLGASLTALSCGSGLNKDNRLSGLVPNQEPDSTFMKDMVLGKVSETKPKFPGGYEAFMKYISENVRIDNSVLNEFNGEGKVVVSFIVEKDGSLSDIKVVKSVYPPIDNAVVEMVKGMPKWIPGTRLGEKVRCTYNLPYKINLHDE